MSDDEIAFADDDTLRQWYCNAHKTMSKWVFGSGSPSRRWYHNNDRCCTRYRVEMERRRVSVPNYAQCYALGVIDGPGAAVPKQSTNEVKS
jgi:hypothetical protein